MLPGQCVQKVGYASGRTAGRVTGTNVTTTNEGVPLIWQHEADFAASGGDSGSAVFWPVDAPLVPPPLYGCGDIADWGGDYVWLHGLLHSGGSLFGGVAYFSDINHMQYATELGGLDVVWPQGDATSGGNGSPGGGNK